MANEKVTKYIKNKMNGHIYILEPMHKIEALIETQKQFKDDMDIDTFKLNCANYCLEKHGQCTNLWNDVSEMVNYLVFSGVLLKDEKGLVKMPANLEERIDSIDAFEKIISNISVSGNHSTYALAENMVNTSYKFPEGKAALHEFVNECVKNYKGNTTNLFYDIVAIMKSIAKKDDNNKSIINADNGHFNVPLKFKEEK